MILKRREKAPFSDRLRQAVAPRKGFWRGMDYIGKRLRRLPDSPHRIALGFACGALASFSTFFSGFTFSWQRDWRGWCAAMCCPVCSEPLSAIR